MQKIPAFALAALLTAAAPLPLLAQSAPLYDALGGQAGIVGIVDDFVKLLNADPRVSASFREADQPRLRKMLAEQFCDLSGGPCKYSGKAMEVIHEDLKITNAQFNAVAEDLQIVLENHQVPAAASNKLVARLAPMQKTIVTK